MSESPTPTSAEGAETLSELYARDPFTLTRDDPAIHKMVDQLRRQRVNFAAVGKAEAKSKAAPKPKGEKIKNLDDLKLDL